MNVAAAGKQSYTLWDCDGRGPKAQRPAYSAMMAKGQPNLRYPSQGGWFLWWTFHFNLNFLYIYIYIYIYIYSLCCYREALLLKQLHLSVSSNDRNDVINYTTNILYTNIIDGWNVIHVVSYLVQNYFVNQRNCPWVGPSSILHHNTK